MREQLLASGFHQVNIELQKSNTKGPVLGPIHSLSARFRPGLRRRRTPAPPRSKAAAGRTGGRPGAPTSFPLRSSFAHGPHPASPTIRGWSFSSFLGCAGSRATCRQSASQSLRGSLGKAGNHGRAPAAAWLLGGGAECVGFSAAAAVCRLGQVAIATTPLFFCETTQLVWELSALKQGVAYGGSFTEDFD
ncbi:hypothetical protein U9M48_038076, partial [Paspalum notatum var. saurae]